MKSDTAAKLIAATWLGSTILLGVVALCTGNGLAALACLTSVATMFLMSL